MKIIGYRIESEYENGNIFKDEKFLMVIECCGLEIRKYDDEVRYKIHERKNEYRVFIRSAHPSINYFIISNTRRKDQCYKWLTKEECEQIVEKAVNFDIIDLREFDDYQICYEGETQRVMITNDYNEFIGERLPILVKMSD